MFILSNVEINKEVLEFTRRSLNHLSLGWNIYLQN